MGNSSYVLLMLLQEYLQTTFSKCIFMNTSRIKEVLKLMKSYLWILLNNYTWHLVLKVTRQTSTVKNQNK